MSLWLLQLPPGIRGHLDGYGAPYFSVPRPEGGPRTGGGGRPEAGPRTGDGSGERWGTMGIIPERAPIETHNSQPIGNSIVSPGHW